MSTELLFMHEMNYVQPSDRNSSMAHLFLSSLNINYCDPEGSSSVGCPQLVIEILVVDEELLSLLDLSSKMPIRKNLFRKRRNCPEQSLDLDPPGP